jgi:hypothetical protein
MHGLFGSVRDADSRQTLDVSISAYGGYDDDMLGDSRGAVAPNDRLSGIFTGMDGGLSYSRSGRNIDFGASAGGSGRYFTDEHQFMLLGEQGGVSLGVHGRSTRVTVSASGAYLPLFGLAPFPNPQVAIGDITELAPRPVNALVQERTAYGFGGGANLQQTLSDRSSLSFGYTTNYTTFEGEPSNYSSWLANGGYSYRLSRDVGVRIGYSYGDAHFPGPTPHFVTQTFDGGLDYTKAFGPTHGTTIGASFGTSAYEQQNVRSYHAIGDASLNHQIGRTWAARAAYHRGVGFLQGFNTPYFADSFTGTFGGSITRRLDLHTMAAYFNGDLGVTVRQSNFDIGTASTRLRYAFSRMLAVYGEYVLYRYHFVDAANLPAGFPQNTYRQGVRAGATLQVPLIR